MAVELIYKHQQKTYELMKDSLEKNGRAAYVFPTGCGKSFPALKYVDENPDKKVSIFAPNLAIKNQYIKYIETYVENGKERLTSGNIEIKTYQHIYEAKKEKKERAKKARDKKTLNSIRRNMKSFSLKNFFDVDSDIVILDEIHRIGAKKWEKVIDEIMHANPNRKVIGMSATPERTDGRNMAYEKFGDDVVYEMSLTEALSGEKEGEVVLKTPRYVRVLSQLSPILKKYKDQIDLIEDDEERKRTLKKYEKIDSIVNNSPTLSDVMLDGMKKKNGKYIVFCKDREDMLEKMRQADEIFGKVNTKINTSYVLSKNGKGDDVGKTSAQNRKTLKEFENKQEGEELNLLFCVDMLNEGVHIPKVDGEVLFDLTSSPILYKQRIGRVLSADKEAGETVIIDAANNWLNHIETYREIEVAIKNGNRKDDKNELNKLVDLTAEETDLLEIMREIGEELKYNNNKTYEQTIEWLESHSGVLPRNAIFKNSRVYVASEQTKEEKAEVSLRNRWDKSEEKKILNEYAGRPIEEVPEEYIEKITRLRSLGQMGRKKEDRTIYEQIIEWLEINDGKMPRGSIKKGKRILKAKELTEEQLYETRLYGNWFKTTERKILNEYAGRPIEEVPEEYREKIAKLRSLGQLGIIENKRTTYEKIIEWLETHNFSLPSGEIRKDGRKLTVKEMTEEQKYEVNLYVSWIYSKEKRVLDEYVGRPIEEIPEKYREKIAKLRSLGIIGKKKIEKINFFEEFIKWLKEHNQELPRKNIENDGERILVEELTEEEKKEVRLRGRWNNSKEKKILDEYAGRPIEEVPEEYREKIAKLRSLGQFGTKKDDKISRRAKKSVSENVGENESTRRELEQVKDKVKSKDE